MYSVGEKIVYGENGVCTVIKVAPLEISGASKDKLYYYLAPLIGTGVYYSPVDSGAFMRPVISREEAEKAALENEQSQKWLEGKTIRKVIVVPGKIVNIVIA